MELIFATSNANKLQEVRSVTPTGYEIISLKDLGFEGELPENQTTIEGNSLEKAAYFSTKYNLPCFAEDTGLEIEALDGRPGVYSARYAGKGASYEDNVTLVLQQMEGIENRIARFKTVLTYYNLGKPIQFEGLITGTIIKERKGNYGFGYDPIFQPEGSELTFAEMLLEEKNKYSHRKRAFDQFIEYLRNEGVPHSAK